MTEFYFFQILSEHFRNFNYKNKSSIFKGDGKNIEINGGIFL